MDDAIISKDREEYDDPRLVTLLENIEGCGIEDVLTAVQLKKGQDVTIVGEEGEGFTANGPVVLFLAALPLEAFEEEDLLEVTEDVPNGESSGEAAGQTWDFVVRTITSYVEANPSEAWVLKLLEDLGAFREIAGPARNEAVAAGRKGARVWKEQVHLHQVTRDIDMALHELDPYGNPAHAVDYLNRAKAVVKIVDESLGEIGQELTEMSARVNEVLAKFKALDGDVQ